MHERRYRRPESVLVVVITDTNEALLLRRKDPPDYWQSVTGSLEWGETALEAARREVFEETGLQCNAGLEGTGIVNEFEIVPPWTKKFAPGTKTNREHVYLLRLHERAEITIHDDEHVEYCWLPLEEAARMASSSTNRDALLSLLKS